MITSIINYIIEGIASAAAAVCGAIFDNLGSGLAEIQSMLPGLESLDGILTLAGAVTVAAGLYLRLASASASSISGRTSEHPVRIGARALAAGASVAAARPLCTYVTGISERVFTLLLNSGGASAPASAAKPSEVIVAVFTDLIPVAGAGSILLHLLLSVIMAWNLIKISLLAFEQYLLLTVSVHLSPLLAGFCVSPATQDIASGFAKAFMGQCLTLTASAWGFRVFTLSLSSIRTLSLTGGISLLQMAVLVLFGGIIASIDTVMAKLGLSSVPSPSEIGRAHV